MTTTGTITISLTDADDESHVADYFQIEDGWIALKKEGGAFVASYPSARVSRIITSNSPVSAREQQAINDGATK